MGRDLFGIKFGAHLAAHLTPEWRSQYLQYEAIVAILYAAVDRAPPGAEAHRARYVARIDERFFAYCNKELLKINLFFGEKLSESVRRFEQLRTELTYFKSMTATNATRSSSFLRRRSNLLHSRYHHIDDLKLAFSELYLLLVLLQNYQTLNYMSFKKILMKHDKLLQETIGNEWLKMNVDSTPFVINQQVASLIDEVERLVTDELEEGNRKKAMQKLRVPPLTQVHRGIVTYRLGLMNGLLVVLCAGLLLVYLLTRHSNEMTARVKPVDWQTAIVLYRSSLILIVHLLFVGINIIGWSSCGINHVLIFELDPRAHISHEEILESGSLLALIWIISFLAFILCEHSYLQAHWQPLTFILLIVVLLLNPFPIMHRSARYWFCKQLLRIFSAPFHPVTFADFWLADQLTSLDLIFYDTEYLICYFAFDAQWTRNPPSFDPLRTTDAAAPPLADEQTALYNAPVCHAPINIVFQMILGALPSWFRMAQCLRRYYDSRLIFPHLVNASKYACGLLVVICSGLQRQLASHYPSQAINPFLYAWILAQILNSGFKFAWDLKMDWGFFDRQAGHHWFLRDELVYPHRSGYYLMIIINFLLRYTWIIRVYLGVRTRYVEHLELILFGFAFLESFRRFLWNFYRLENEHLNNCGQFRAVRDISINPTRPFLSTNPENM